MFSHIVLGADDIAAAKKFYDATLGALGHAAGFEATPGHNVVYKADTGMLIITKPRDGQPATHANGGTVGFAAPTPAAIDAFHAAGLAAGGTDEGAPGPRDYIPGAYGAYLRDPTGNKLVAWYTPQG